MRDGCDGKGNIVCCLRGWVGKGLQYNTPTSVVMSRKASPCLESHQRSAVYDVKCFVLIHGLLSLPPTCTERDTIQSSKDPVLYIPLHRATWVFQQIIWNYDNVRSRNSAAHFSSPLEVSLSTQDNIRMRGYQRQKIWRRRGRDE